MRKYFKTYDKVLVRHFDDTIWMPNIYGLFDEEEKEHICIDGEGYKYCIPFEGNENLIGKTDGYVEPYEPKDGDFVVCGSSELGWNIGIFKCYTHSESAHCEYVTLGKDLVIINDYLSFANDNIRLAAEEEKCELLSKLHESGKDWDAENKQVVDYKWKPEQDDVYYSPVPSVFSFYPCKGYWDEEQLMCIDAKRLGWFFQTEEECQALCDKLNHVIEMVR